MRIPRTALAAVRNLPLASMLLAATSLCNASDITYFVSQTIGTDSVTGDIVTDGTIGNFNNPSINIVGWNLLVNGGLDGSFVLSSSLGNSTFQNQAGGIGGYFSATQTQLLFNFSSGAGSYFQGEPDGLLITPQNPQFVWCLQAAASECVANAAAGQAISVYGFSQNGDTQFRPVSGTQVIATAGLSGLQGGSSFAPLLLPVTGTSIGGLTGTIGGLGSEDYYSFLWGGGAFSATAFVIGANAGASYLFSEGADCSSGGSGTLNGADGFSNTIAVANLPAGEYCIGIDANAASDPNFVLTFNTPVTGVPGSTAVPEPSGFVSLSTILGTVTTVCLIRKRSRKGPRI